MQTLHRHPDLHLTNCGDEGLVLHVGERRCFAVNEVGLTILRALEEPRTFAELVARILVEYEVDHEEAEITTRTFIDQCLEAKLMEYRG